MNIHFYSPANGLIHVDDAGHAQAYAFPTFPFIARDRCSNRPHVVCEWSGCKAKGADLNVEYTIENEKGARIGVFTTAGIVHFFDLEPFRLNDETQLPT